MTRSRRQSFSPILGYAGSAFVSVAFIASVFCSLQCGHGQWYVSVIDSSLILGHSASHIQNNLSGCYWSSNIGNQVELWPEILNTSRGWSVSIPLWIILATLLAYQTCMYIRGPLRRHRRRKRNQCLQCGYNLTGNASGTCPECGEAP